MSTCFYIIRTPLQYLGALEHFHARQDIHNHVLITDMISTHQYGAIRTLVPLTDWSEHLDFWRISASRRHVAMLAGFRYAWIAAEFSLRSLSRTLVSRIGANDTLVVGNPGDVMCRWFLKHACCKERVVVDDGLANVEFALHAACGDPRSRRDKIQAALWGNIDVDPKCITYFTMFASLSGVGYRTTIHHWRHLSQLSAVRSTQPIAEAWFLGQGLVGNGYLPLAQYEALVNRCISACRAAGLGFRYACHPSEAPTQLPLHWLPFKLELPIEWHLVNSPESPCAVISAFSSALVSLAQLLPKVTRCAAVQLGFEQVLPPNRARYERVLDCLRKEATANEALKIVQADELGDWLATTSRVLGRR